ncbi:EAL domain-containing protein [Xanthomonas campestris pv. incanae]|uniref:EAL domain-containing protein n=1 Tax=Xanthomonas campestris TaxID=339 RepID=UPI0029C3D4E7|nr:EAL domain-containing protein [Xanthomonas campestris]MDX6080971.1 EAL domain-containing protein [Xanthomonas campestris pv. incanae]MDX6085018.1 EAL domain-containing protein [Xanthomonas campestris pv. incanae]MDX6137781.1 EAL domain-containing protein [Xanthomonas campestris pv. incanae]
MIFTTELNGMTRSSDEQGQQRHLEWRDTPTDLAGMEPLDQIARLVCHSLGAAAAALTITESGRRRVLAAHGIAPDQAMQTVAAFEDNGTHDAEHDVLAVAVLPAVRLGETATAEPARFAACVPIGAPQTGVYGTLCVLDAYERRLDVQERQQLRMFANVAAAQLELQFGAGRREPHSGLHNARQLQADLDTLAYGNHAMPVLAAFIEVYDTHAANEARQALGMQPIEELVRHASYVLTRALRGKATVYHVAPMRFTFFLLNSAADEMEDLLLDLRDMLHAPVDAAGIPMSLTFHAGVVKFLPRQPDTGDVMRKGLVALGDAVSHHAILCWYSAAHDDAIQRSYRLALDAEAALEAGDFRLVFQPRINLLDLSVTGFEALLRWKHATLGAIGPDEFIPLFEKTALMCTVTEWVIDHALRQLAAWRAGGLDFSLSINLSSRDFGNVNLASDVIDRCQALGIPTERIELEITEGRWLRSNVQALPRLRALRDAGVSVAIDDFGTGYSNFGYLTELPVNVLKLDRSLVTGIAAQSGMQLRAEAVVRLASALGYRTVAEGIEHADEIALLRSWGCDEAQGFLLARPMEAELVPAYVAQARTTAGLP